MVSVRVFRTFLVFDSDERADSSAKARSSSADAASTHSRLLAVAERRWEIHIRPQTSESSPTTRVQHARPEQTGNRFCHLRLDSQPALWLRDTGASSNEDPTRSTSTARWADLDPTEPLDMQTVDLRTARAASPPPEMPGLTVMIRNVSFKYNKQDIMDILASLGFSRMYKDIIVPNSSYSQNKGYFFVSFQDNATLTRAISAIDGAEFGPRANGKLAEVRPARHQGKKACGKRSKAAQLAGDSE